MTTRADTIVLPPPPPPPQALTYPLCPQYAIICALTSSCKHALEVIITVRHQPFPVQLVYMAGCFSLLVDKTPNSVIGIHYIQNCLQGQNANSVQANKPTSTLLFMV